MRSPKFTLIYALLGIAVLTVSCNKKKQQNVAPDYIPSTPLQVYTNPNTGNTSVNDPDRTYLNQLFSAFRSTPQTFTVTAGQYWRVWGTDGTMLSFYPNSFKDAAGNIISSGSIQIKLIEMYKPGSMISNRATTTADGALLRSGGQVYITASKNNQTVYANKYSIGFSQAGPSSQPMMLYYGNANNADSVVTWAQTNVLNSGTSVLGTVTINDSAGGGGIWQGPPAPSGPHYYNLFDSCTSFTMINCDYFTYYNPLTVMTAISPDTSFNSGNTTVYLVFPLLNSVTTFRGYILDTHAFNLSGGYKVPIGMNAKLVAMTNKNGSYFYYEQSISITDNMVVNLVMQPQSYGYITNALLNL